MKSKDFVKHHLELLIPEVKKYTVTNKKGNWDERNGDMYDGIVCAMYDSRKNIGTNKKSKISSW